ncbi:MAG: V-type ATP synthase subunit A, partial [Spirochaetales bacterium]|nr:V-type ATP synthase subunit A [Spirochaetales bacterium]
MAKHSGHIISVNGNMVNVRFEGSVSQNEVGYIVLGDKRLKSEVIKINGKTASMQVFEMT